MVFKECNWVIKAILHNCDDIFLEIQLKNHVMNLIFAVELHDFEQTILDKADNQILMDLWRKVQIISDKIECGRTCSIINVAQVDFRFLTVGLSCNFWQSFLQNGLDLYCIHLLVYFLLSTVLIVYILNLNLKRNWRLFLKKWYWGTVEWRMRQIVIIKLITFLYKQFLKLI